MAIRSADSLPVLDFRSLSHEQLLTAQTIFEEFRTKALKPAYLADADSNRALLDRLILCDLLGFDEETYLGVRRLACKVVRRAVGARWEAASKDCQAGELVAA